MDSELHKRLPKLPKDKYLRVRRWRVAEYQGDVTIQVQTDYGDEGWWGGASRRIVAMDFNNDVDIARELIIQAAHDILKAEEAAREAAKRPTVKGLTGNY